MTSLKYNSTFRQKRNKSDNQESKAKTGKITELS